VCMCFFWLVRLVRVACTLRMLALPWLGVGMGVAAQGTCTGSILYYPSSFWMLQ
jgi:hypothetical protein